MGRQHSRMEDASTSEAIAGAVRAAMARRRMTQVELREAAEWSTSYLRRRVEGEVDVSLSDLIKVAGALRCDPASIISGGLGDHISRITGNESVADIVTIARLLGHDPAQLVAAAVEALRMQTEAVAA